MSRISRSLPLAVLLLGSACAGELPEALVADTVLIDGKILTVDEGDSVAEAVAIRDGRILAVGTTAEIQELAGARTKSIDLHGATAIPGLLDAHCHFASGGTDMLYVLDLSYPGTKTIQDIVAKVEEQVKKAKGGDWIQGDQ